MRRQNLIILIACLQGASGVALAAAAAHAQTSRSLEIASSFLLIHAAVGLGLAGISAYEHSSRQWLTGLSLALQASVTLFAADLAARSLLGTRIFPYAAPIGGSAAIISWLGLSVLALKNLYSPTR